MYRQFAKKYILGCSLKKIIRMFSKKKKSLHFNFISDFPISLPKSGCSLHILAQEFQVQNSSNKASPQNIQATPFGVATHSLTNTAIKDLCVLCITHALVPLFEKYKFIFCMSLEKYCKEEQLQGFQFYHFLKAKMFKVKTNRT